nr:MAG TPA: hypothetical protein [Caudoviricetes sp.]
MGRSSRGGVGAGDAPPSAASRSSARSSASGRRSPSAPAIAAACSKPIDRSALSRRIRVRRDTCELAASRSSESRCAARSPLSTAARAPFRPPAGFLSEVSMSRRYLTGREYVRFGSGVSKVALRRFVTL